MKKIFKALHIHIFITPVLSKYVGFNTRDIVFECRCGERKVKRESRAFGVPFSIEGMCTSLDHKQFQEFVSRRESETTLMLLDIDRRVSEKLKALPRI